MKAPSQLTYSVLIRTLTPTKAEFIEPVFFTTDKDALSTIRKLIETAAKDLPKTRAGPRGAARPIRAFRVVDEPAVRGLVACGKMPGFITPGELYADVSEAAAALGLKKSSLKQMLYVARARSAGGLDVDIVVRGYVIGYADKSRGFRDRPVHRNEADGSEPPSPDQGVELGLPPQHAALERLSVEEKAAVYAALSDKMKEAREGGRLGGMNQAAPSVEEWVERLKTHAPQLVSDDSPAMLQAPVQESDDDLPSPALAAEIEAWKAQRIKFAKENGLPVLVDAAELPSATSPEAPTLST